MARPAFYCDELSAGTKRTVYFHHEDVLVEHARQLKAKGEEASGAKCELKCFELCELVHAMLAGVEEWRDVDFVGPSNASDLKEDAASAIKPLGPEELPPELEEEAEAEAEAEAKARKEAAEEAEEAEAADAASFFRKPNEPPPSTLPWGAIIAVVVCVLALAVGYVMSLEDAAVGETVAAQAVPTGMDAPETAEAGAQPS